MATYRLWPATDGPGAQVSDSENYTLAVEFYVTDPGCSLTQIHFWASGTVTSSNHACRLYSVTDPTTGTLESGSSKAFASPLQAGWNTVTLDAPIALTEDQRYRAAVYFTTDNGYTATGTYWAGAGGGASGITNGPLTAPNEAGATGNDQCSFAVGSDAFPTGSFGAGNYWVDVTIDDGAGGEVTGTIAASLGALTAAVTGTRSTPGTIAANLGGLSATVAGTRSATSAIAATLGALSATVAGTRTTAGSIAASLGGLTATVAGTRATTGSITASLGGLSASLTGALAGEVTGSITCSLGGLTVTLTEYVAPTVSPGSWGPLLALVREARTYRPPARPTACPNDGEPLQLVGGRLHCVYDGWMG